MEEKGATNRSLAAETGISTRTIDKARKDAGIAECRLSTLVRIATALEVDAKDLFHTVLDTPLNKE